MKSSTIKNELFLTRKQASLLGISKLELDILNIAQQESTILQISRQISIPRTTLYLHTKNLCVRKLLLKIKKGKKFIYVTASKSHIASMFLEVSLSISNTSSIQVPEVKTGVQVFKGKKELSQAWLRIGNQPVGTTVLSIQPTKSLEYSIPKVPHAILRKNHENIISKKIFLEAYCENDLYNVVAKQLHDMNTLEETLPDFENRKAITYLFNTNSFNTTSEIFLLSEGILLTDWKDEFGILIENAQMSRIIYGLLNYIKPTLKIANYKEEMNKALQNLHKIE